MKIIGVLVAWAAEDWIEYCIKQITEIVDELLILIIPFNKYFKKLEDKTLEKAKKYVDNKKIKLFQHELNQKIWKIS